MIVNNKFAPVILVSGVAIALLAGCTAKGGDDADHVGRSTPPATAEVSGPSGGTPLRAFTPKEAVGSISTCNIESFDNQLPQSVPIVAKAPDAHSVSGWVAAPNMKSPTFWLRFEDKAQGIYLETRLHPSIERADVVKNVAPDPMPLSSGFKQEIPSKALPSGNFHLYIASVDGETESLCDNGRMVNVK